tara:strand:- start:84 stop:524 length:441 start_codon:yes stop_codon:yes gene_type:complete
MSDGMKAAWPDDEFRNIIYKKGRDFHDTDCLIPTQAKVWIDRRLHIIIFEETKNPNEWCQDYCCAQAYDDLKYSCIRINQIEIRQANCCDSTWAIYHSPIANDLRHWMGKVYYAPYDMMPKQGNLLHSRDRCSKWNEDGSDFITLW